MTVVVAAVINIDDEKTSFAQGKCTSETFHSGSPATQKVRLREKKMKSAICWSSRFCLFVLCCARNRPVGQKH